MIQGVRIPLPLLAEVIASSLAGLPTNNYPLETTTNPMPRLYHVHLTTGAVELYAVTQAQAIRTALELAAPGAKVLSVCRQGDW